MELSDLTLFDIQPSQFYVSQKKLEQVEAWLNVNDITNFEPVPVKRLDGTVIFTDGHTRALAAFMRGMTKIPLIWDEDELDWEAYRLCVRACNKRAVFTIADLRDRIIKEDEYQHLWNDWCDVLHEILELQKEGDSSDSYNGDGE